MSSNSESKVEDTSTQSISTTAPNTNNNNKDSSKRKTIIPLPACCQTSRCGQIWKITKYVYVIGIIILGFLIAFLTQISDSIDEWFDNQQKQILTFLIEDAVIYIMLVLLLITILKSIGVKDVLGLRTISVCVLAYRIVSNSQMLTLLLSMFIIGILSSISKLIEYQVIGHELQVVQGTPVEFIFKYLRILLNYCIKNDEKLEWLDPKYTFEISEKSRYDKSMHVMDNIKVVLDPYFTCENKNKNENENENENENNNQNRVNNINTNNDENNNNKWKMSNVFRTITYFIISVIWTSVIEWVQPITELFLFAHNWSLTFRNAIIIVLSEFADFDKAVEAWFIINGLYSDSDIIGAKVKAVASKGIFWALGYCIVAPPTLIWAYLYHKKYLKNHNQNNNNNDDIEMNNNNNNNQISNGHNNNNNNNNRYTADV